jgi:hypothetical protein
MDYRFHFLADIVEFDIDLRGFGNPGIAERGIDIKFHYIGEEMEPVVHGTGLQVPFPRRYSGI